MRKFLKKIACTSIVLAMTLTSLTACGKKDEAIDGTKEAMKVNEDSVNLGVANFILRYQQASMVNYYAMFGQSTESIWSQAADDGTYGDTFKKSVQDSIAKMYLLKKHAPDYSVEVSDDDKTKIADAAEAFVSDNDEKTLTKLGITKEDIQTVLTLYTYQSKMYDPMVADVDTNVSDDDAAQSTVTYVTVSTAGTEKDADGKTIDLTDEQKASKKDEAQQVLDKVKASGDTAAADMDALAKEVNAELAATQSSFGSDDTTLADELKNAAKSLTDGKLNDQVIETDDAYYVLRLDKAFDEEKTTAKKESIVEQRKSDKYNEIVTGWLDDATVKTTAAWNDIEVKDADAYTIATPTPTEEASSSSSSSTSDSSATSSSSSTSDSSATSSSSSTSDSSATSSSSSTSDSSASSSSSSSSSSSTSDSSASSSSSAE